MFYVQAGMKAIGSRLRRLSSAITEDAEQIYSLYCIEMKPKWFPVFYMLSQSDEMSTSQLASGIGQSHPSVVVCIKELVDVGIVNEERAKHDGRKNVISLTVKGSAMARQLEEQYDDMDVALSEAISQTTHNLWKAMEEFEYQLEQSSLFERIRRVRKDRKSKEVQIVAFHSRHRHAFKALNEACITKYFNMEEMDHRALDNPDEYIINQGGYIAVAEFNSEIVGVCVLIKKETEEYEYELAKMAVSPQAQGLGIGFLLGKAIIDKARSLGVKNLYLESNTKLIPAIKLYQKLGFVKVSGCATPYERCNIQMMMNL